MPGLQQFQLKVRYTVLTRVDIALQYFMSEKCNGLNSVKFKDFFHFFLSITYDLFHFEEKAHFIW